MSNVFGFPTQKEEEYWTTLWGEMFGIESDDLLFLKITRQLNFYHDLDKYDFMSAKLNRMRYNE